MVFQINQMYRILQIEDLPSDAYLVSREVKKTLTPCEFIVVDDKDAFLDALQSFKPHLIISDYSLPGFSWYTAIVLAQQYSPGIPFIVVTGSTTQELRNECTQAGVSAFINKNTICDLGPALKQAIQKLTFSS
jgi:CheY-like chemotaxis protein